MKTQSKMRKEKAQWLCALIKSQVGWLKSWAQGMGTRKDSQGWPKVKKRAWT